MCDSQRALRGSGSRTAEVPKGPSVTAAGTAALASYPKAPHVLPPAPVSAAPVAAISSKARDELGAALAPALPGKPPVTPATTGAVPAKPRPDLPKFAPAAPVAPAASGPAKPPVASPAVAAAESSIDPSIVKGVRYVLDRIEMALAERPAKATNLDYLRSAIGNVAQTSRQPVPEVLPNLPAHQKALAKLIQPYLPADGKYKLVRRAAGLERS